MSTIDYFTSNKNIIEKILSETGTPVFVTDESILSKQVQTLQKSFSNKVDIFYAIKANYNPGIVKSLKKSGIDGIETISPFEIKLAKKYGFSSKKIIFTGNNLSFEDLEFGFQEGVIMNIGSIHELKMFCERFPKSALCLRINPGFGDGECKEVITGGEDSKFGINHIELDDAITIILQHNCKLIGLHTHLGSGLYDTSNFSPMLELLCKKATRIDTIEFIDLGGGFGINYKPSEPKLNIRQFDQAISEKLNEFPSLKSRNLNFIVEPGKFLVAESTFLLTKITNIRNNNKIICLDTGFNHIIRPAFYNSYHHIINLSKLRSTNYENVKIVGNICESGDILATHRDLAEAEIGDNIAIMTAGAYCSSMSSLYNLRPYAAEVIFNQDTFEITRKKMNMAETYAALGYIHANN